MTEQTALHHYMLAFFTTFGNAAGQTGARHMNMILAVPEQKLPMLQLFRAQQNTIAQLQEQGIPPDDIKSLDVLSINYLGLMTPDEFDAGMDEVMNPQPDPNAPVTITSEEELQKFMDEIQLSVPNGATTN